MKTIFRLPSAAGVGHSDGASGRLQRPRVLAGESETAMSRSKMVAAALVAVGSAGLLSACDGTSPQSLPSRYGCDTTLVVSGPNQFWNLIVANEMPQEISVGWNGNYTELQGAWDQLMRARNHFGGRPNAILPSRSVVIVPRKCASTEKPPKVTPTLVVTGTN